MVRTCPGCGRDQDRCGCPPRPTTARTGTVRLEKRRGKPVTVCRVEGVGPDELRTLARKLRAACGTGGTVRPDGLELQGDHRDRVRAALAALDVRVPG